MANLSLRRYDVQARFSVYISVSACVTLLGMVVLLFGNFDWSHWRQWIFVMGVRRRLAITVAGLITLLLASIGFGMGLSSAGQRRNDKQKMSWIGFFIGAAVLCATFILFFVMRTRGEAPIIH